MIPSDDAAPSDDVILSNNTVSNNSAVTINGAVSINYTMPSNDAVSSDCAITGNIEASIHVKPINISLQTNDTVSVEDSNLACTLCQLPLTATTKQNCMLSICQRPFCANRTSCDRFIRVDQMLFCSMLCAQKERVSYRRKKVFFYS